MTRKQNNSIDGFIPRRAGGKIGELHDSSHNTPSAPTPPTRRELYTAGSTETPQPVGRSLRRSEIDDSLKGIDAPVDGKGKKRKTPEQRARRKKIIKRLVLLFIIIILACGGYYGVKALLAGSNVLQGNVFDLVQHTPLKMDSNGRSNVLILGTSEDDPGHEGANLTDSMMILSVDQNKKNVYMISIPRDLYVKYGQACNSGYAGKINEYYNCAHEGEGVEEDRKALTKEAGFVGGIFGLDIQYGVNVNYTVMRDMVNAVGGSITVNIESRNPNGQMDSNFDWKCGVGDRKVSRAEVLRRCPPSGHFIDYPNGPAVLDAEHALYLAQARGDKAPTYGFEQSNFDREKNQQKIIKAIREKAVSAGVLTDFGKVTALIDALGNNLRTTFETKEFRTLVDLAKDTKSEDIKSISLIDGDTPVMGTGMVNGMSVVRPAAGTYEYSELQALIKKDLSSDPVLREGASVVVLNGSGIPGVAQTEADKLKEQGYTIGTIANAPAGEYGPYTVYQIGSGNTGTAAKLKKLYNVTIQKTAPPVAVAEGTKFVVVVGSQPSGTSSAN
ncbi:LCP family protein [Candidatus Saccharibacteria bacterium]|nr:LCP family protein [Candidatus Saccharibacteria bacterium]